VRFAGFVNHRVFERKWRSRVRSRACLFECQQPCSSAAGAGACACAPHALLRREKPRFLRKALGVRYSGARASCLSQTACVRAQLLAGCRRVGYQAFRRGGMHFACRAPRVLFPNLCMRWARWRAGLLLLCVWHAPCASCLPAPLQRAEINLRVIVDKKHVPGGVRTRVRVRACAPGRVGWRCGVCVSTHNSGARSIECGVLHSPARGDPQSASQPARQHQHHDSKVLLLLLASVACLPGHRYDVPGLLRALHLLGVNCAPLPGVCSGELCARACDACACALAAASRLAWDTSSDAGRRWALVARAEAQRCKRSSTPVDSPLGAVATYVAAAAAAMDVETSTLS
jgi:hypothetical protein